jgi:hypothetical protein
LTPLTARCQLLGGLVDGEEGAQLLELLLLRVSGGALHTSEYGADGLVLAQEQIDDVFVLSSHGCPSCENEWSLLCGMADAYPGALASVSQTKRRIRSRS